MKELEGERVRLQELVETEEQRSHEIRIELDNTTQKLSALESKCTDQQDLLKQSAIECEKIAAQCKTLEVTIHISRHLLILYLCSVKMKI